MNPFGLDKLFGGTYFNGIMTEGQYTNCGNQQKLSAGARLTAGAVFLAIGVGFALLWASAHGHLNLSYWFGVCGFKQRFGLPCPGCGWTHAAEMFATGHFLRALQMQPAAGLFCVISSLTAIFALHCAVFGINSRFLQSIFCSKSVSILLAAAGVIILAGWMVCLVRTILENTGS